MTEEPLSLIFTGNQCCYIRNCVVKRYLDHLYDVSYWQIDNGSIERYDSWCASFFFCQRYVSSLAFKLTGSNMYLCSI